MTTGVPLLRVRGLVVRRGGAPVLDVEALDVARGALVVLVGPNGAGKSTLLLALAGLLPIVRGEIALEGMRVGTELGVAELRRRIGMVFQEPLLLGRSVHENVALGLRLRGVPRLERRTRVDEWLARLGIAHLAKRSATKLSGGEAQRVSLARALAIEPDLLLLDEPFAALDGPARGQLRQEFRSLQRDLGRTVVLVTHELGEACALADLLGVMDAGRIVQLDTPQRVVASPVTPRVAEIVGAPGVAGTWAAPGGEACRGAQLTTQSRAAGEGRRGRGRGPW